MIQPHPTSTSSPEEANQTDAAPPNDGRQPLTALCDIALHAWRLQRRMTDRATKEVRDEHRPLARHVTAILDTLEGVGLTLRDRESEAYDYGLPEKVVAVERSAAVNRETVLETIRPTLFFRHQIIKAGEIIIALPLEPGSGATSGAVG